MLSTTEVLRFSAIILIILVGCQSKAGTEKEILTYLRSPENGVIKTEMSGDISVSAYYKPGDLVWMHQEMPTDKMERDALNEQMRITDYFIFEISREGREIENSFAGDPDRFTTVVNYLTSGIADRIQLTTNRDTFPASSVTYVRNFGYAGATQLLVSFPSELKSSNGKALLVLDDDLLGAGHIEFEFDINDLKRIPTLIRKQ